MRNHHFLVFSLFLLALFLLALFPHPALADWPLFRGNALQSGTTDDSLPEKLEILWKITFKEDIESTAAIVGKTVFIGCFDQHLYALDLATGKEKWKFKMGAIKAPISVSDGAVYVGDDEGDFYCIDAAKGTKRWQFATGGEIAGGANFSGDKVIVGSYGDATLYCLAKQDGKLLWKFKTNGPVNGSAVVAGDHTFVAGCDGELHIVDLKTGNSLASVPLSGPAGATAAVLGDKLYVGTMSNNQLHEIDVKQQRISWTCSPKSAEDFYSSAAVTAKLVIVGNRNRSLHALDRATGNIAWTFATKKKIDSSPVVVGQFVYVGSSDGSLYVLNLAGKLVQKLDLGRGIVASPAVSDGCLVIGTTDGHLYCLGKK